MSWVKGNKPNMRTGSKTAPSKTPRSYESHPGIRTFKGANPVTRTTSATRREGKGAKNQDLRAKM